MSYVSVNLNVPVFFLIWFRVYVVETFFCVDVYRHVYIDVYV